MEQRKFEVGGKGAVSVLIIMTLLFFFNYADRTILSVALEPIKQAFSLSDTQAGALPSLLQLGVALLGIPAAIFGDRWARRKAVSLFAFIWTIATFATAICANFLQMGIARFFVGSGEAGFSPVGATWLSMSFPKNIRSRIMSIFFVGGQIGGIAGLIFGGMLITATHDWRTPFYVFAIPGIILGIIILFCPDYKSVKADGEATLSGAFFREWGTFFKIKSWWFDTIGQSFLIFAAATLPMWMPTIMQRAYKLDPGSSGMVFGLSLLIMILAAPLGGFLADKWQQRSKNGRPYFVALAGFMALVFTLYEMLVVELPIAWFIAGIILSTFCFGMIFPVFFTIKADVVPAKLRATAAGMGNFVAQITGGVCGSLFVGAISDALGGGTHGLQWGMIYLLPIALLGVVAYLFLTKFYPADSARCTDEVLAEK
ncbi:MAG: MFS transporter [Dehalococcoidia bacterium]|jgi:MFS family permease